MKSAICRFRAIVGSRRGVRLCSGTRSVPSEQQSAKLSSAAGCNLRAYWRHGAAVLQEPPTNAGRPCALHITWHASQHRTARIWSHRGQHRPHPQINVTP